MASSLDGFKGTGEQIKSSNLCGDARLLSIGFQQGLESGLSQSDIGLIIKLIKKCKTASHLALPNVIDSIIDSYSSA